MTGHTSRIHSLSFSAETSLLVSGSSDCTLRVWDVKSAHQAAVAVKENGSGGMLGRSSSLAASAADKARVEDNFTSDLLVTLPTKRTPISATQFTPRNLCLAAGPIY